MKWDKIYQSTLDHNYPPDSGFSNAEATKLLWQAFKLEGENLLKRLKEELNGKYIVEGKY